MYGFGELVPQHQTEADKLARAKEIREQMQQLQDEYQTLMREIQGGRR